MLFILHVFLLSCFAGTIEGMPQQLRRRQSRPGTVGEPVFRGASASQKFLEALQRRDYVAAVALLDKRLAEVSVNDMFEGKFLLCEAISTRNKLIIAPLAKKYEKLHNKNSLTYLLALDAAVKTLDIDIVQLVLDMYRDRDGSTIVYDNYISTIIRDSVSTIMSYRDSGALVELLMGNEAIAETVRSKYMQEILNCAIEYVRTDIIRMLFRERDCLDMSKQQDAQVLFKAFKSRSALLTQVILDHTGWYGMGAQPLILRHAVNSDDPAVVKLVLLRMRCADKTIHAMIGEVISEAIEQRRKIGVVRQLVDCFALPYGSQNSIYPVHPRVREEEVFVALAGEEWFAQMLDRRPHPPFHGKTMLTQMLDQVDRDGDVYARGIVHLLISYRSRLGIRPKVAQKATDRVLLSQRAEQCPFAVRAEEQEIAHNKHLDRKLRCDIHALLRIGDTNNAAKCDEDEK